MKAQPGTSLRFLYMIVLLILVHAFEIQAVTYKTTNGDTCQDGCVRGQENKYWCEYITLVFERRNAHCSPRYRTTYYGANCSSDCKPYLNYFYCDTAGGWDYCGPTTE